MGGIFTLLDNKGARELLESQGISVFPCQLCMRFPFYEEKFDFYLDVSFVSSLWCGCSIAITRGPKCKKLAVRDWNFYQLKIAALKLIVTEEDAVTWFYKEENKEIRESTKNRIAEEIIKARILYLA